MTNIINLFNFIESNRPEYKTPFNAKLIYDPESLTKDDLIVGGDLNLLSTPITTLPDNLTIKGSLILADTPITTLPDNLTVGDILVLSYTPITTLPDNLKVGGNINLLDTPLSKQYSKDEIRKMIQDKGGNIGGNISI